VYCKSIVETLGWEAALPSDNSSLGDYQATVLVAARPTTRLVLGLWLETWCRQRAHDDHAR
jgi:hypothetical protein